MIPSPFSGRIMEVHGPAGAAWLRALPETVRQCVTRWDLRLEAVAEPLSYNYVAYAVRGRGTPVVLKAGIPGPALMREAAALQSYAGRGAVHLLDADLDLGVLLLERLRPGASLHAVPEEEAIRAAAAVMRRLHRPAPVDPDFPTVNDWAEGFRWLRERFSGGTGPLPEPLVARAEALFRELASTGAEPVLLHGDLHHGNILAADREAWLAIDPKGVVGEPAYEAGAFLRNGLDRVSRAANPAREMSRRIDRFAEELEVEPSRVRGWGLAQAVLSAIWWIEDHDSGWEEAIACAEWLAGDG